MLENIEAKDIKIEDIQSFDDVIAALRKYAAALRAHDVPADALATPLQKATDAMADLKSTILQTTVLNIFSKKASIEAIINNLTTGFHEYIDQMKLTVVTDENQAIAQTLQSHNLTLVAILRKTTAEPSKYFDFFPGFIPNGPIIESFNKTADNMEIANGVLLANLKDHENQTASASATASPISAGDEKEPSPETPPASKQTVVTEKKENIQMFENIEIDTPAGLKQACKTFMEALKSDDENIVAIKGLLQDLSETLPNISKLPKMKNALQALPNIVDKLESNIYKLEVNKNNQVDVVTLSQILEQVIKILDAIKNEPDNYVPSVVKLALLKESVKTQLVNTLDYFSGRLNQLCVMVSSLTELHKAFNDNTIEEIVELYAQAKFELMGTDPRNASDLESKIKSALFKLKAYQAFRMHSAQNNPQLIGTFKTIAFELSQDHVDLVEFIGTHHGEVNAMPSVESINEYLEILKMAEVIPDAIGDIIIPEPTSDQVIISDKDENEDDLVQQNEARYSDTIKATSIVHLRFKPNFDFNAESILEILREASEKFINITDELQNEIGALTLQLEEKTRLLAEAQAQAALEAVNKKLHDASGFCFQATLEAENKELLEASGFSVMETDLFKDAAPDDGKAANEAYLQALKVKVITRKQGDSPGPSSVPPRSGLLTDDLLAEISEAAARLETPQTSIIPHDQTYYAPHDQTYYAEKFAAAMFVVGVTGLMIASVVTGGIAAAFAISALAITVPSIAAVPVTTAGVYYGVKRYNSNSQVTPALPAPGPSPRQ